MTPTPWKIRDWYERPGDGDPMPKDVCNQTDSVIATFFDSEEDAALAVRAVNEREGLLAVLTAEHWATIDRAIEKYSKGEASELLTLAIVAGSILKVDEARQAVLTKAGVA